MKKYLMILMILLLTGCTKQNDLIVRYHNRPKYNLHQMMGNYQYYYSHQINKFNSNEVVVANDNFLNYIKLGIELYNKSNGKFNFVDQDKHYNNVLNIAFNDYKIKSNQVKINKEKLLDSYLIYQITKINKGNVKYLKYKNITYTNNKFIYSYQNDTKQIKVTSNNPIKSEVKTYQYRDMKIIDIVKESNQVDSIVIKDKCSSYHIKRGVSHEKSIRC